MFDGVPDRRERHRDAAADRGGREPVRRTGTQGRAVAVALMANCPNLSPSGRVSGGEIGRPSGDVPAPCPERSPQAARQIAGTPRQAGRGTVCRMWRTADGHGQRQTGTGKRGAHGRQRRQAIDNGGAFSSAVQDELKAIARARQIGNATGRTARGKGKPDAGRLRRCVRQIGTPRRAVCVRLMAECPAVVRRSPRQAVTRPAAWRTVAPMCPARSPRAARRVLRTARQIGRPSGEIGHGAPCPQLSADRDRREPVRRDRHGAPCPNLSPSGGCPARSPRAARQIVGTPQGERHGAQERGGEIGTGANRPAHRNARAGGCRPVSGDCARTCPAHRVRRDRNAGRLPDRQERHGTHGRGHRDAAADRGGREPVRHTGTPRRTLAALFPAIVPEPVRRTVSGEIVTAHRVRSCPHLSAPVRSCPHLSAVVRSCPHLSAPVRSCPQLSASASYYTYRTVTVPYRFYSKKNIPYRYRTVCGDGCGNGDGFLS